FFAQPISSLSLNDPGLSEPVQSENLFADKNTIGNELFASDITDVELLSQTPFNESMGFDSLALTPEETPKIENPTQEKAFELSCPEFGVTPSLAELMASNDLIEKNFQEKLSSNHAAESSPLKENSQHQADDAPSVSDFLKMTDPALSSDFIQEENFSTEPTASLNLQPEIETAQMPAEIAFAEMNFQDEILSDLSLAESYPSETLNLLNTNPLSEAETTGISEPNRFQDTNPATDSLLNLTNQTQELKPPSEETTSLPKQPNAKKRFPGSAFQFSAQRDLYRQDHARGNQNFGAFPEGYHPLEESLKELKTTSLKHEAQFTKMSIDHLVSQYFSNKEADLNTES
ncbi:MAG: hypothetical protein K2X66_12475, partial [Cyanobacteria bacterium]|nr:hypothetical protein [Cyanobacteriota bacterium]